MPSFPRLLAAFCLVFCLSAESPPAVPEDPVEIAAQLRKEMTGLKAEEYSWQRRFTQPSTADITRFTTAVHSLKDRYPLAAKNPANDDLFALLQERAAFYEQEQVYRDAHPQQAAATGALKKQAAGVKPGASKEELDRFFENSNAAGSAAATAGTAGAKQTPATVPGARTKIDASVPPTLSWHFVPGPTEGMKPSDLEMRKKVDADGQEQKFVEKIMGSLDAPIEREVLETIAREQGLTAKEMLRRAEGNRTAIARIKTELGRKGLLEADKRHLEDELARDQKNLKDIGNFSTDLVVSVGDFPENTAARTYVASDPDGKQHVRVIFNRTLVWDGDRKTDNPEDAARKVAAHEFTHAADFYALSRGEGPSIPFVEPRAFRNGALSYKQEGMPPGKWVEKWGGSDYRWLRDDPMAFLNRQVLDYAEEDALGGPRKIWEQLTPDDYADSAKALDWRMQYAYRYASVMGEERRGETRAARFERVGIAFHLDDDSIALMKKIDGDASIPDSRKPGEFARQAALTESAKIWIKGVSKTDPNVIAKARRQEKDFLDSLKPLFP